MGVLLAAPFTYYLYTKLTALPNPISVNISKSKLPLTGLDKVLPEGVKAVIFVSEGENNISVITATHPNGDPIDLCGEKQPSCLLSTSANALMLYVRSPSTSSNGYCPTSDGRTDCHKNNRKYPFTPDGLHHSCSGPCT